MSGNTLLELQRYGLQYSSYWYTNSYVKVNDIIVELYTDNPIGEVKIIDLDSNDDYLELACFNDGPSGDSPNLYC